LAPYNRADPISPLVADPALVVGNEFGFTV